VDVYCVDVYCVDVYCVDVYWVDVYCVDVYWVDVYCVDVYCVDVYWVDVYWVDVYWVDVYVHRLTTLRSTLVVRLATQSRTRAGSASARRWMSARQRPTARCLCKRHAYPAVLCCAVLYSTVRTKGHASLATCHLQRVTCNVSLATCHLQRVTCNVSHTATRASLSQRDEMR
jgi:hypothetical protein